MPLNVTPTEFREFSSLVSGESYTFLMTFIVPAIQLIEARTGKGMSQINSQRAKLACLILCLQLYNQRDFPSKQISEAVDRQVASLIASETDIAETLILGGDDP